MIRTPRIFTIDLAAGQLKRFTVDGKTVSLFNLTVGTTLDVAFQDSSFEPLPVGRSYSTDGDTFTYLQFRNNGLAATVATVIVSDGPQTDTNGGILMAIAASLVSINSLLTPGTTITPIAPHIVPAIDGGGPGTATQIVAANASRKAVRLFSFAAGTVYIGKDNNVQSTNCIGQMTQNGTFGDSYTGALFAVGSDAAQEVGGYELS